MQAIAGMWQHRQAFRVIHFWDVNRVRLKCCLIEFTRAAAVSTRLLESEFLFFGIPIDDVSVREYRTAKQIIEV